MKSVSKVHVYGQFVTLLLCRITVKLNMYWKLKTTLNEYFEFRYDWHWETTVLLTLFFTEKKSLIP